MYELDVTREFSAAHHLKDYNGNCAKPHGHNWTVQVFLRCSHLDEVGIGFDFKILKKELDEVLSTLDHSDLNTHAYFQDKNPTSENLAEYIYKFLGARIDSDRVKVKKVRVCESGNSGAAYFEE
ncbi:MAG: 6-carboxytetrahydropterin synthase [Lentisphaeria bacterium]|nr:6-carboxytetrahydropterin synthase [Lentisphaeria bacterium]